MLEFRPALYGGTKKLRFGTQELMNRLTESTPSLIGFIEFLRNQAAEIVSEFDNLFKPIPEVVDVPKPDAWVPPTTLAGTALQQHQIRPDSSRRLSWWEKFADKLK